MKTLLRKGDRVTYAGDSPLGYLKKGDAGIVVEVYPESQVEMFGDDMALTAAVAWPSLRKHMPDGAGPLVIEGLDLSRLHDAEGSVHEGDVVPMADKELEVTGNIYDEGDE